MRRSREPVKLPPSLFTHAEVVEWKKNEGDKVQKGEVLGRYEFKTDRSQNAPRVAKIIAPREGSLCEISVPERMELEHEDTLCVIEYEWCPHDMVVNFMCTTCFKDLSDSKTEAGMLTSNKHDVVMGHQMKLQLSQAAMQSQADENTRGLLRARKLLLILDIDHTLLHAMKNPNGYVRQICHEPAFKNDVHGFNLPGSGHFYSIKLRPHVREFLQSVKDICDVRVYTMGLRRYAEEILKVLDPGDDLIGHRIVCRDDHRDSKTQTKDFRQLIPVDERMILIIDDRAEVWPNVRKSVIQVPQFSFFPGETFQTGPNGEPILQGSALTFEQTRNKMYMANRDNVLNTVSNLIHAVHSLFYRNLEAEKDPKEQ